MKRKSKGSAALPMLVLLPSVMLAAGCSMTSGQGIKQDVDTDAVCTVWLPISSSKSDTAQTRIEVKGSNAARKEWCNVAS
ncbi:hypothetical protein HED55_00405 [Ochrobactrum haematophilum]|uniref:Secreted protein n=1 Tax=Brucella haematophila TaxID=419474 RepID=A0ABX1DHP7_9HYPH|nr:hypothetical protein [Brucella haematophila]